MPVRVRIVQDGYCLAVARVLQIDRAAGRVLLQVEPDSVRAPAGTELPARWWYQQKDDTWVAEGAKLACRIRAMDPPGGARG
ncbi:MAG: hypothetical protein DIU70_011925 [Bacillota bacterium]